MNKIENRANTGKWIKRKAVIVGDNRCIVTFYPINKKYYTP